MIESEFSPCGFHELALTDNPDGREEWRRITNDTAGMRYEFGQGASVGTRARTWALGGLDLVHLSAVNLSLRPDPVALEDHMFIKLVTSGVLLISLKGDVQRFSAGSLVVTDPASRYEQRFDQRTELVALRFPKSLLVERGVRASLPGLAVPNMEAPDSRAIRDFLLSIGSQSGATSHAMRERQAAHILDLIGVLAGDPSAVARIARIDVTLSRAKSYIAQHLHNVDLDVKCIASAIGVSGSHLHRAFDTEDLTLMRYVWSCRLERAADLLTRRYGPVVTIREIAYRCGFQNPAHFSRTFKERFGVSPREAAAHGALCRQRPTEFSAPTAET